MQHSNEEIGVRCTTIIMLNIAHNIMNKAFSCLYLLTFSESTLNEIILCSHTVVVAQQGKLLLYIKQPESLNITKW